MVLITLGWAAQAADWVALGKGSSADQYFYDRSKLTIKDDQVTYWKKVVFAAPQSINGKTIGSGLLRERIDCAEHTAKLISYLYYAPTGEMVEYLSKDESEAAPIIPDTVGDAFEQKLCPQVWRKQDENRIKAEQKAVENELAGTRSPAVTAPTKPVPPSVPNVRIPISPSVTPPAASSAPSAATPPASPAQPTPNAPSGGTVTPASPAGTGTPATPTSPSEKGLLPMPQIIEQLY
jgi:hypothetical protein